MTLNDFIASLKPGADIRISVAPDGAVIAEIYAALATIVELAARPSYVTMAEVAGEERAALLDYCGGTVGTLPRDETDRGTSWCAIGEGYAYRGNVLLGRGVIVNGTYQ